MPTSTRSSEPERMKISRQSSYTGIPFDVFLVIFGTLRFHPSPNIPLGLPVLYCNDNSGLNPFLPSGNVIGIEKLPVPVCKSAENFSPRPFSEPPPLGNEMISFFDELFELIQNLIG